MDTQLFLPELLHVISLTMAVGSLLMRQTMYGLLVNMVHCLATNPCVAEMDGPQLHALLQQAQRSDVIAAFGLQQVAGSLELSGVAATGESEHDILSRMEKVAIFLGDVLSASAISMGEYRVLRSLTVRLCQRLACSLDGASRRYLLSAQPSNATSSLHGFQSPGG